MEEDAKIKRKLIPHGGKCQTERDIKILSILSNACYISINISTGIA